MSPNGLKLKISQNKKSQTNVFLMHNIADYTYIVNIVAK